MIVARLAMRATSTLLVGAIGVTSQAAHADVTPGACGTDEQIRCAVFDANEVFRVPYRRGVAMMIQLEPGEVIDGPASGLGMGDAKAWTVGAKSNWILFKPREMQANTNLLIITDRRRYAIKLVNAAKGETPAWSLSFIYPDTIAKEAAAEKKKAVLAADRARYSAAQSVHSNSDFDMMGDTILAPTSIWDDGRFTYFKYATTRDRPVINRMLPDGSEALVNSHVDGDTTVVHETDANFMLRLGASVLQIRNNRYSPDGQFNTTGTTVPGVVRVTKEHHE